MKTNTQCTNPFKLFFLIQKGSEFQVVSVSLSANEKSSYTLPKGWKFVKVIG